MFATLRRITIELSVTLLFSFACWGQTSAFEGDVKGEDGKPMVGAMIHLDRKDIKGSYKVKTDKKGHYYYGGLPLGMYKIWIEVDGKERDAVDGVKSGLGDPKKFDFDLKASGQTSAAKNADIRKTIESGGELTKEQTRDMTPEQKAALEKKIKEQQQSMAKNKALNDAFNAGKDALTAQKFDAAVESFEKAKEMDPAQNVIWGNLADAYVALAKTKTGADQQTALDKGIEAYKKAIELKPDDSAYHNNYALALAQAKKFDESQAELTKAAQLDPANAGKYYFNLGAVLVNTGQLGPAEAAFKKAIDADPNYADAYYQFGITLMGRATLGPDGKMAPVAGTAEAFQKYLELRPDGKDAETAKLMLEQIGAKVETEFSKPGAKKQTPKKKQQ